VNFAARKGFSNPVLIKELRSRFRGPRAFAVLTVFLVLLAGLAAATYFISTQNPYANISQRGSEIGTAIFVSVGVLEMLLVATIAPALASAAVSGEVERRTFDLLVATPLSSGAIVWGKAAAAMAYIVLLVASCMPILSLAFLFGGVSAQSLLRTQLSMLVLGFEFVAIGVLCSAVLRRSSRAAFHTYAALVLPTFLAVFLFYASNIFGYYDRSWIQIVSIAIALLSPLAHVGAALMDLGNNWSSGVGRAVWVVGIYVQTLVALGALRLARRPIRGRLRGRPGPIAVAWLAAFAVGLLAGIIVTIRVLVL
jgi:ABC-2 type transport system permease protein